MPPFTVRNDRIQSVKMEFNLVEGCNYSCVECSHFSPHLRAVPAQLESFATDVRALREVYRVRRFRFVGGEPLLHRDILGFVRELRQSDLTRDIELVTNGSLLGRASDELLREIDSLSVSWYPDPRCTQESIDRATDRCRRFGTELKVKKVSAFRMMQLDRPFDDARLSRAVFATCEIAHSWYCQTFYEGRFYLCSRPIFTDAYLAQKGVAPLDLREVDGIPLHEPALRERLTAYLGRREPLAACRYCLGTVGREVEWRQMTPEERRSTTPLERAPEASVSRTRLRALRMWGLLARGIWRVAPSLRLARGLQLAKELMLRA